MSALSKILKKRREELGLTLAQVADAVGVTEATVQRWESGNIKTVRYEKLAPLSSLLGVSPADLMGWSSGDDLPSNISRIEPIQEVSGSIPLISTKSPEN